MSNKLALAKIAVNLVGAAGVSKVINDIVTNNTSVVSTVDAVRVGQVVL